MKKVLLFLCIFCLGLGSVACSKNSDTVTAEKPEVGDTDVTTESADDENNYVTDEPTEEDTTTAVVEIVAKDEIINASWDSGLVQFNDTIIQLPANLSTFVDAGMDYEIWLGKRADAEKSYLIGPGEEVRLSIVINGTEFCSEKITNTSNDFLTMADINPLINDVGTEIKPEGAVLFFPGGLTFGDSYKLVTERLGEAKEVTSDMMYVYGDFGYDGWDAANKGIVTGFGMEVHCDKNEQCISGFRVVKSPET